MKDIDLDQLAAVAGGYMVRSNGYNGEPVIRGYGDTYEQARRNYMDNCRAAGNWRSACWLNRAN